MKVNRLGHFIRGAYPVTLCQNEDEAICDCSSPTWHPTQAFINGVLGDGHILAQCQPTYLSVGKVQTVVK